MSDKPLGTHSSLCLYFVVRPVGSIISKSGYGYGVVGGDSGHLRMRNKSHNLLKTRVVSSAQSYYRLRLYSNIPRVVSSYSSMSESTVKNMKKIFRLTAQSYYGLSCLPVLHHHYILIQSLLESQHAS